jgi:hypothetical protein
MTTARRDSELQPASDGQVASEASERTPPSSGMGEIGLSWAVAGSEKNPRAVTPETRRRAALLLLVPLAVLYPWECHRVWSERGGTGWTNFLLGGIDPAALVFYWAALVGVARRYFWVRVLTIYFFCQLILARLVTWPARAEFVSGVEEALAFPALVVVVCLLWGKSMRALFEDQPARWNLWADADPALERVRWLMFAEVSLLNFFYAFPLAPSWARGSVVLLGAVAVAGLAAQRRWAVGLCLASSSLAIALLAGTVRSALMGQLRGDLSGPELVVAVAFAAATVGLALWVRPVAGLLRPRRLAA